MWHLMVMWRGQQYKGPAHKPGRSVVGVLPEDGVTGRADEKEKGMLDTIDTISETEEREAESPLKFEELLARFQAKMNAIPAEYHEAMGWLYIYRQIQDQRKRLANRANQMSQGKRVFWASVLAEEPRVEMQKTIKAGVAATAKSEEQAAAQLHKAMRHTSWYRHVAVTAARGVGISEDAGTLSAAKLLWAYGSASRFPLFGSIVRYSRLAPENGKAPGRIKGRRIHYNPQAWQALFDLSETWNRLPDCCWRVMWDAFKIQAQEKHPDWPKWKVHAWGRRKMLREFLRDIYEIWLAWEARQGEES